MSNKVALQARIDQDIDIQLRTLAAKHRKRPNFIIEAALLHCFGNKHFISKLTQKEEAIDY